MACTCTTYPCWLSEYDWKITSLNAIMQVQGIYVDNLSPQERWISSVQRTTKPVSILSAPINLTQATVQRHLLLLYIPCTDDIRRPVDGSVFFASPEESLTVTVWPLLRDVQTGVYSLIRTVVLRLVSVLAVAMKTHTHSDIHRPGRPACPGTACRMQRRHPPTGTQPAAAAALGGAEASTRQSSGSGRGRRKAMSRCRCSVAGRSTGHRFVPFTR